MYVMGDLKLPALFLFLVSTLAIVISLLGLSFPYSAVNQCPKRVFFQVSMLRKWCNPHYSGGSSPSLRLMGRDLVIPLWSFCLIPLGPVYTVIII